jgi:hypothetical protein
LNGFSAMSRFQREAHVGSFSKFPFSPEQTGQNGGKTLCAKERQTQPAQCTVTQANV